MSADLSLLQYSGGTDLEMRLSRPHCSGAYAVGVQKLAQQFLAELLTLAGSVRFDPNYGCSFLNDIRLRNANAIGDIQRALVTNIGRVSANMRGREIGDEPADNLLGEVQLTDSEQNMDQVVVSIRVSSEAGNSAVVQLPLDLLT
jgi:hypothetical protein